MQKVTNQCRAMLTVILPSRQLMTNHPRVLPEPLVQAYLISDMRTPGAELLGTMAIRLICLTVLC